MDGALPCAQEAWQTVGEQIQALTNGKKGSEEPTSEGSQPCIQPDRI